MERRNAQRQPLIKMQSVEPQLHPHARLMLPVALRGAELNLYLTGITGKAAGISPVG